MSTPSVTRTRISFESGGVTCAGTLYAPGGVTVRLPCVVMANGFSGTMDWILPAFAERFAAAGLAVLAFDYRHLGGAAASRARRVQIREYAGGHFDLYHGALFEQVAADQIAFLRTHLR